ncbi:MAG: sensor histidine [Desulfovibrionaceae bacterium]|nr:MAG: sensor histidine [Desulfovibrionaceae bacterium]
MNRTSSAGRTVDEREMFMELIGLLSSGASPEEMLTALLPLLQHWSGCEAVGIRLRTGHEHPYIETDGFAEDFIYLENRLCPPDEAVARNARISATPLDKDGCDDFSAMSSPNFTAHGTFWNNGAFSPRDECEEGLPPRSHAGRRPYQSMALVPLRYRAETFGILLFKDSRPGRFNPELISFLEKLADNVALALSRIQAERTQKENEELYRAIFCVNIALKLLIDPGTGAIIDANAAACEFYGYSYNEMTQLRIQDIDTMPSEQVLQILQRSWTGKCRHFLFKHRLASGELRDVEVYSGPVQRQGRPMLFSIVHDVTKRIQAEEMRQRVEAMLRHDLKSPLSGILGLSKLVEDRTQEEKVREWAAAIRECSEGMLQLVELNLDMFKMEQGLFKLEPTRCDLARMLHRLRLGMSSALSNRELEMRILLNSAPLGPEVALSVSCNAPLVENMFSNLLQNALEASPQSGMITVEIVPNGSALKVGIHNQGAVPDDIRHCFFQKYATSGKRNGTGLGAYSARLIAQAHGGGITFHSSDSEGTSVTVTLPINHIPSQDNSPRFLQQGQECGCGNTARSGNGCAACRN